jgi:hypothetical protein
MAAFGAIIIGAAMPGAWRPRSHRTHSTVHQGVAAAAYFHLLGAEHEDLPAQYQQRGLRMLTSWDEVWVKLDASTQEYMTRVNCAGITLEQVLANILGVARTRPVIIQILFSNDPAARRTPDEIEQYVQRLRELKVAGAQIELVQIYSAHRPAHRSECKHLPRRC